MPPNFLFLIADDHRHDAIESLGNPAVHTPTLDALAAAGTALTSAYIMGSTSNAVCMPSRAMLMTGRSLFRVFAPNPEAVSPYPMDPETPTFPQLLRGAGYRTYGVGKWHNEPELFARSFNGGGSIFFGGMSHHDAVPLHEFDPDGVYPPEAMAQGDGFSTEMFVDRTIQLLRDHPADRPFCIYTAFTSPHDPRTPPAEFAGMYPPGDIELPLNFARMHPFDNGHLHGRDESLAAHPRDPDEIRQHIADYYGMISHLDSQIGRLLDALAASGHAENTIVVYTADHGLAVGQHGLLGKQNVYDHSLRVPLIMRGPGIPAGQRREGLCYLHDMFPTILDLAGLPVPSDCDGVSLVSALTGQDVEMRDGVFAAFQRSQALEPGESTQRMVRRGDLKLIETRMSGHTHLQLFNLADDPWEIRNLADVPAHAERLTEMRRLLHRERLQAGDPDIRESGA
ncbi:MAG: sulfatase-like hydrolase/transferase [Chloroflexota bacterium]|nr:sulfatase-like hydrolase/transferase [Chloroflexota bacterium]MDE2898725.1 sulfatase-like hydrolase/transferase [Chloroflexota bacterium]